MRKRPATLSRRLTPLFVAFAGMAMPGVQAADAVASPSTTVLHCGHLFDSAS